MLTHVVCMRFADLIIAGEARDRILAMKGRIPALLDIECGVDIVRSGRSYELALITRHADLDGMQAYQVHPIHQGVLAWIKQHIQGAVSVDFVSARPAPGG
jgi:hypothetical protein